MPPTRSKLAAAEVRRLLRQRTGRDHVLLTGRGATAIWATLRALDLHDCAVLLPANTCYIVLWVVLQSGNQPFLVDVDPLTANISTQTLDQCEVAKPAVLIPAHMYGLPAPMQSITNWAAERNVFVIEDAALALGTIADGKPAGSWGDVSIFSFGSGKIADAGNGGALLTNDANLAAEIERVIATLPLWTKSLEQLNRQWLEIYWATHQFEADNARLADLYPTLFNIYGEITRYHLSESWASGLRTELLNLDANIARRNDLTRLYDRTLSDIPAALVRLFESQSPTVLWRYPILVSKARRPTLLERLWREGIFAATRWYPSLQPMRNAFSPDLPRTATPAADQLSEEIINLPLDPDQAAQIIPIILDTL
jgi:dTDP-4-amino-4,6-dideoxygalactose transaminase